MKKQLPLFSTRGNWSAASRAACRAVLAILVLLGSGPAWAQVPAPYLGEAANFALLGGGPIQSANNLTVFSQVGSMSTVSGTINSPAGILQNQTAPVPAAIEGLVAAQNWCDQQSTQGSFNDLNGRSLPEGVYTITDSNALLTTSSTLTLNGDTSSVYIFNFAGDLTLQAGFQLDLGQVRAGHVYWNINNGSLQAESGAALSGVIMARKSVRFLGDFAGVISVLTQDEIVIDRFEPAVSMYSLVPPIYIDTQTDIQDPALTICPSNGTFCVANGRNVNINLVRNGSFDQGYCTGPGPSIPTSSTSNFLRPDIDGYPGGFPGLSRIYPSRPFCWQGYGSPDWFKFEPSGCNNYGGYSGTTTNYQGGVPNNWLNETTKANRISQPARTGSAYAGLYITDSIQNRTTRHRDEREYLMQTLEAPVPPGRPYYVEYFASLAPTSHWAARELEVAFRSTLPNKPDLGGAAPLLTGSAVTVVVSKSLLPTTPGWTCINGAFVAPPGSNYNILMLGNFKRSALTKPGPSSTDYPDADRYTAGGNNGAYYFIDDVSLIPFPSAGPAIVTAPCNGGPVQLGDCGLPLSAGATCTWTPTTGLNNPTLMNPLATIPNGLPQITYQLVVQAFGQTYTTTTTVVRGTSGSSCPPVQCLHNYHQNASATYVADSKLNLNPWELGDPNFNGTDVPTIDGGNPHQPVVFDGVYHVVSPVMLQKGTFEVRPGTVFYVDGGNHSYNGSIYSQCFYSNVLDSYNQIILGSGAVMDARGALFTTTCNEMWGGLELRDNAKLSLTADRAKAKRSEISQARVGVLLGTGCQSSDADCLLTGTDFENNGFGVASLGFIEQRDTTRNKIVDCYFHSDLNTILPPYTFSASSSGTLGYTQTGLVLRGPWHDGIAYTRNRFASVYVGAEVAGGSETIRLYENTFTDNYGMAIRVGSPLVHEPISDIRIEDNDITVPDNPLPGGQVTPSVPVYGIQVLPLIKGGNRLYIEHNQILGEKGPGNAGKVKIGLDMELSFTEHYVQRQNRFQQLDLGLRFLDAAGATTRTEQFSDNFFQGNTTAVDLYGQQYAVFAPYISCNTFMDYQTGINIEPGATVGQLSGPPSFTGATEACANKFDPSALDIVNQGIPMKYYYQDAPFENVAPPSGLPVALTPVYNGTTCSARQYSYGYGSFGLNRPTTGTSLNPAALEYQLSQPNGSGTELLEMTLKLIDYRQQNGQLTQLENFANSLIGVNNVAFRRISLFLLEQYRHDGQVAAAQQVRQQLLSTLTQDADLVRRISCYDVMDHLLLLSPGQTPAAADSLTLVNVAGSPSGYAPVACSLLRYFYPQVSCSAASTGGSTGGGQARSSGQAASTMQKASRSVQVQAYPNPAQEQVTLELRGLSPQQRVRVQLLEVSTGHSVREQKLANGQSTLTLSVEQLPAGVYAVRILGTEAQLLGTNKLVIIH